MDIKIRALDPVADEEEIAAVNAEKTVHKTKANEGQRLKDVAGEQNKPHIAVICSDLQQALPTPKFFTGLQYYKHKMWTFNFGVHNIKEKQATMYVWNENEGK